MYLIFTLFSRVYREVEYRGKVIGTNTALYVLSLPGGKAQRRVRYASLHKYTRKQNKYMSEEVSFMREQGEYMQEQCEYKRGQSGHIRKQGEYM